GWGSTAHERGGAGGMRGGCAAARGHGLAARHISPEGNHHDSDGNRLSSYVDAACPLLAARLCPPLVLPLPPHRFLVE
ncbi:unnamed protein product, partial [Urochloa humidicola]